MRTGHFPILTLIIACGNFARGQQTSKIRNAAEDRQISKLIFKSKEQIEASLNASGRGIAQTAGIAPSTAFYILTQVLHLAFRDWK
jgi:hypothetical protein